MPNGYPADDYCDYCGEWAPCHRRNEEDYVYWIGMYCDECLDWIDDDDELWRKHWLLEAAQWNFTWRVRCATSEHCLIRLFQTDEVAKHIAQMIVESEENSKHNRN